MDSWVLSFAQELQGNELRDGRHERKREREGGSRRLVDLPKSFYDVTDHFAAKRGKA